MPLVAVLAAAVCATLAGARSYSAIAEWVHDSRKWRTETCCAITSLPARHTQPTQLAAWIRGHCKVENQLHWVRDVTFGEDLSEARTGTGPHVMASQRVTSPSASCASPLRSRIGMRLPACHRLPFPT
jgi:predicted transposase YbfD/YdcC